MTFDLDAIAAGLPAAAAAAPLREALADGPGTAVVQAPPGSGKTTVVPPLIANLCGGKVLVTAPRRIAARAAAARLAELTSTAPGVLSGHTVRGDRTATAATPVEFLTTGVLLRRLLSDPGLEGVGAVILDEVHERTLESDLLFGMLGELRLLREDLRLVAMSATLDAARWAALLGDGTPVVEVPTVPHPLEIVYADSGAPMFGRPTLEREAGLSREHLRHVAATARAALGAHEGDALVFLPGVRECETVAGLLAGCGAEVLTLSGRTAAPDQQRIVRGGGGRRVVVSTAVAESSLTVPGVRIVVDACVARIPRSDASRGLSGLVTARASKASCDQRAGRAARLGPGFAYRCVSAADYAAFPAALPPESASADLTSAALDLACWGSPRGAGLTFPDPLPAAALDAAEATLRALGAIDESGAVTHRGRRLAAVPAEPRLARALLDGAPAVGVRVASEVVAMLAAGERAPGGDLMARWREVHSGRAPGVGAWRQEARRFARLVPAGIGGSPGGVVTGEEALAAVVALAYPERIARLREDGGSYLLASGTGAQLPRGSALAGQEWLAVAEVMLSGSSALIHAAVPLGRAQAEGAAAGLVTEETVALLRAGRVTARRERRLGAITLSSSPVRADAGTARAAVAAALAQRGLGLEEPGVFDWPDSARQLRSRLGLLRRVLGEPWPEVSEASLLDRLAEWLAPEIDALAAGKSPRAANLEAAMRRLLPWPQAARFDELAPGRLDVPSGRSVALDYPEPGGNAPPVLAVKLQEVFGLDRTPRIADGRVPVLLHLLSPAGRPLAVTDDLESFWNGPYAHVRAENRGRYPKHPWPEDPWRAPPKRGTKGSGR